MSRPRTILTLETDLLHKPSFGHIRRQYKLGQPKVYTEQQSQDISFVNRCTLLPKNKVRNKPQLQAKYLTVDNDCCFATQIPFLQKKQNSAFGKIVNQSRSVSRRKDEEQERERKDKLGELYRKKSELLKNLKLLDSRSRTKTQPFESRIKSTKNSSLVVRKQIKQSRSYINRNSRYIGQNSMLKPKANVLYKSPDRAKKSPQSISSIQRNRGVLSFIKKMNKDTIKREISRTDKYHKDLVQQLKSQFNTLKLKNSNKSYKAIESTHFDSYFK